MVIGVKIRNRKTGEFRPKGFCTVWNKKGKTWASLRDAKLSVCPSYWGYEEYGDFVKCYKKELDSDFIIFNDDGTSEKIPVLEYYIERIQKKIDKHYIGYELLEQILKEIKEYCKIKEI